MRDYAQSAAATPTTLGDLMKEQMSGEDGQTAEAGSEVDHSSEDSAADSESSGTEEE